MCVRVVVVVVVGWGGWVVGEQKRKKVCVCVCRTQVVGEGKDRRATLGQAHTINHSMPVCCGRRRQRTWLGLMQVSVVGA